MYQTWFQALRKLGQSTNKTFWLRVGDHQAHGTLYFCAKAVTVLEGVLTTDGVLPADRAVALVDLALALDKAGRREEALAKADEAKKIAANDELRRQDPELLKFVDVRLKQMQPETVEEEPKPEPAKKK